MALTDATLRVAEAGSGQPLLHIAGLGRVPDQPHGLVAALGQQALQQERDFPVPARDDDAHAVSLLTPVSWIVSRTVGPGPFGRNLMTERAGFHSPDRPARHG